MKLFRKQQREVKYTLSQYEVEDIDGSHYRITLQDDVIKHFHKHEGGKWKSLLLSDAPKVIKDFREVAGLMDWYGKEEQ